MPNPYAPPEFEVAPPHEEPDHPVADEPRELPPVAEGDDFVSVYSTDDVVMADMLDEMLRSEGIPTPNFGRASGGHIGLGFMKSDQIIRVPASQRELARTLIEAFIAGSPNELEGDDDDLPEVQRPPVTWRRSLFLFVVIPAAIAAILLFLARA